MQITDKLAVSIHYTLTNGAGEQLDSSRGEEPMVYLHGAGQIIPGLENALTGKQAKDRFTVTVEPAEAYGERVDAMTQVVSKEMFGEIDQIEAGMQFHAETSQGMSVVTVTNVEGDQVTIDGNHPLAGETLTFDVEVMDVRTATAEEIEHQHVHSESCSH